MDEHKLRERVLELLNYDPDTGIFTRKVRRGRCLAGSEAGSLDGKGYSVIRIDGNTYKAHRLAFLVIHRYLPEQVDHINLIKDDNRISNLRAATNQENKRNACKYSNNTSGSKGVCWHKSNGKWQANAKDANGKQIHLGYFATVEAAAHAYDAYAMKHHGAFYRPDPQ
jgi:hypothetical protein